MIKISVVISTFNPNMQRLNQTLVGLKNQTFIIYNWELLIIDNNSDNPFTDRIDISWHPNGKITKEPKAGLTYARLKGFQESQGNLIIMVDDDNILSTDYLANAYSIFENDSKLGAIGGKSLPLFDFEPPSWLKNFYGNLALRDLGEEIIIEKWQNCYPESAPIGAGMVIKKSTLGNYIDKVTNKKSIIKDRTGKSLSSGGDNDIILEILKAGLKVGYFPSLTLKHIIPLERTTKTYLGRLNKDSTRSWIVLLNEHKINPWYKISRWSVPLRKIKAWFIYRPWSNESNFIRFCGACGLYDALSELKSNKK
ncbi:glycosyl transferase family 2 [Pedobacter psychrotolerans]|uniref:Glycosyl transferase family 2 n=1 Tax=Pedobacter psychrotolerans TaxID=1843235 RepID=A0A4V2S096_9SPHI|nr:glycosyltransferase [Pedobacter psychrotolerans]TCO30796.1 glycosyl transferase family 2 [Pedobacter psychrotolerans]GGE44373.1 hypothetical protein GCM10011413_08110 [Pedobacter psychrotolerans]